MLDLKSIRNDYDEVERLVKLRGKGNYGLPKVKQLVEKRREVLVKVEELEHHQKEINKQIPLMKKSKKTRHLFLVNLKNYQKEDGSIMIPKAVQAYMGGKTVIK